MTKKDISELSRRFKKEDCTFTKMCGCYVGIQKNIVLHINETFLTLKDDEFYKYLELAKKTLSGTLGNNLLELSFVPEEEASGGKQQFLLGLKESKLKNEELLLRLYEQIIANYECVGNYLILIFHDAYDVMTKTKDNQKLDESEEVYDYLLCAICPVELSKAGLGYLSDENRFGARIRDWLVSLPEAGFLFPAFSDRSSDIHSLLYYTKNAKLPHVDFMESAFGCIPKRTVTEEKNAFNTILKEALDPDEAEEIIMEIQQNLKDMVEENKFNFEDEPIFLTDSTIQSVMIDSGLSEETAAKIQKSCQDLFGDTPPSAENIIDARALAANAKKINEQNLQKQVSVLKQQLEETKVQETENSSLEENKGSDASPEDLETAINTANYGIVLKVSPQKLPQITSQIVDGKKCIIIPVDDDEQTNINGVDTEI